MSSLTLDVKEPESQGDPMRVSTPPFCLERPFLKLDVGEEGRDESAMFLKSKLQNLLQLLYPGEQCVETT